MSRGAPVAAWALPEARTTFRSLSDSGKLHPTSPMIPDLIPVPSTPTVTSSTIFSKISSSVRSDMSGG